MHTVARPHDIDDDEVVHHAVHNSGGDHRVAQVISEFFKIDIRSDERGSLAVPAVDDLEEEGCVPGIMLLKTVEPQFIDKEDIGDEIL